MLKKIFLVKLAKGRFGPEVSALLATMLVSRFQASAMKRGEMPIGERRDFYLYVDEATNLPSQNVTELLSEARKYRLGLVLATQYCSQLGNVSGGQDDLLAAVFGNVGSLITFRTGNQDAEMLAKGFAPYFSSLDIMSLPNFYGYARMNLSNQAMSPFSFRTELDTTPIDEDMARGIRELSRLRYGNDSNIVDRKIRKRVHSWKQQDTDEIPIRLVPTASPNVVNPIVLEMSVGILGASIGLGKWIKSKQFETIWDIASLTETDLIDTYECTCDLLNEIISLLNQLGCCLKEKEVVTLPRPTPPSRPITSI